MLFHLMLSSTGHPFIVTVGCVAGDEESYEVFKDFFDPVIDRRHGGYKADAKHKTDLNWQNLKGGIIILFCSKWQPYGLRMHLNNTIKYLRLLIN